MKCYPIKKTSQQAYFQFDNDTYPKSFQLHKNKSIDFDCLNQNEKTKIILYWNKFYGHKDHSYGVGKMTPFIKHNCPVTNCELTNDRSKLKKADFVIVHITELNEKLDQLLKFKRPAKQRWIFFMFESPLYKPNYSRYNNFFNLTSTYTIDSTFPGAYEKYSRMRWELNDKFNTDYDFYSNKTKFAVALISNCRATNRRLNYINELKKFIKVDLFGKCGEKCPTRTRGDCKIKLAGDYKFYFSFENSMCRDYITEKFFYILQFNIIPVVMGAGNYDYYVPKSGYINVLDYKTPKDLADYLIYLDSNKTAYNSYFKWKKYVKFDQEMVGVYCDMCIHLHLEDYFGVKKSVIKDLGNYWNKNTECTSFGSNKRFKLKIK